MPGGRTDRRSPPGPFTSRPAAEIALPSDRRSCIIALFFEENQPMATDITLEKTLPSNLEAERSILARYFWMIKRSLPFSRP